MDNNTRYFYEVRPRKPVRIPGQRATLTRRSILLTKEEVKEYMKCGPVYRKSTKGELILVTGANLEKLHAPFDGEKVEQPSVAPTTFQHSDNRQIQQPGVSQQNGFQQWNNSKKNKKHNNGSNNDNYHGDDRGKAVTNDNTNSQPQYNSNNSYQQQSKENEQSSATPVVDLP